MAFVSGALASCTISPASRGDSIHEPPIATFDDDDDDDDDDVAATGDEGLFILNSDPAGLLLLLIMSNLLQAK